MSADLIVSLVSTTTENKHWRGLRRLRVCVRAHIGRLA